MGKVVDVYVVNDDPDLSTQCLSPGLVEEWPKVTLTTPFGVTWSVSHSNLLIN